MSMDKGASTVVVGPTVQSISVASDGTVWAATTDGQILQNTENSQAWMSLPGTASWLSVSPDANMVCAVANGTPVYCTLQPVSAWATLGNSPPEDLAAIEMGVAPGTGQDTVYAIDTGHLLWTYNFASNSWTQTTISADQIAATSDGAVFRVDGGALTQLDWSTGQWTSIAAPESLGAVAAGAAGWLWVVGTSGQIYQFDPPSGWVTYDAPTPGTPTTISCGDDTTVWALTAGTLYQFDPSTSGWSLLPWTGAAAPTFVSVGDRRNAWVLDSNPSDNIWQYTENEAVWETITGSDLPYARQLSAVNASMLWLVDTKDDLYTLTCSGGAWTAKNVPIDYAAHCVGAADDGTVWTVDTEGCTYEYVDGNWQQRSNIPLIGQISVADAEHVAAIGQISVADAEHVAATDEQCAWTWSSATGWAALPTTNTGNPLVNVSIMAGGALWAVDTSGLLYLWLKQWISLGSPQCQLLEVSGTAEVVWAIDTSNAPLQLADGGLSEGTSPQPGAPGWDAENVSNETQSTHLWIVNRAASLADNQGEAGRRVFYLLRQPTGQQVEFRDAFRQGLYDADFKSEYNNPVLGRATWASHFYDPDTGENWLWESSPTAVTSSASYFEQALGAYLATPRNTCDAGYYLGLALHYMTDLTQPMHAANFTWLSSHPIFGYHTGFESYVMEIQSTVPPPGVYVPSTYGTNPTPFLIAVAANSKRKYYDNICPNWVFVSYAYFSEYYKGLAQDNIGAIMTDAITFTAQYLVAWMQAACTVHAISVAVDSTESKQMCCLDGAGGLWHRVWPLNGQPTPWAPVASQMNPDCGSKSAVAVALASDGTLYVFVIANGIVQYATRNPSGAWNGTWTPVASQLPSGTPSLVSLDCTVDGLGAIQVTVVDASGTLWHTILPAGGTWQVMWGNVGSSFGAIGVLACAGDGQGGLHVIALQNSNGTPWYIYRDALGSWNANWLSLNGIISPAKNFTMVSCAVDSEQNLQVAALDLFGGLWHAYRNSGGTWQTFWGQVSAVVPGTQPATIVAAGAFANVWLVPVTMSTGTPMMAERYASGTSWSNCWWFVGQPPV